MSITTAKKTSIAELQAESDDNRSSSGYEAILPCSYWHQELRFMLRRSLKLEGSRQGGYFGKSIFVASPGLRRMHALPQGTGHSTVTLPYACCGVDMLKVLRL